MDLQRVRVAIMMLISIIHAGMYHLNLPMFYILKEKHREIVNNLRLLSFSKRFFYLKKLFIERKKRTSRIKAGRSNAWWEKFQGDKVSASEWKDNFRMTKQSFYELCEIAHHYLVKKKTTRFRAPVSVDTQGAMFLWTPR